VLEENAVYRLGDATPRPVDVRLIAMTNRTLRAEVAAGRFRRDLYHRLAVTTLTVPPLRERVGDVALLAGHFLHLLAARHGSACTGITPAAMAALAAHDWPGNVRELRNAIEGALLVAGGLAIDIGDLPPELLPEPDAAPADAADSLEAAEQAAIARAMAASPGNLAEAARQLGISRSTLYRKLERYRLKP
jgi:DNA-binding NtrC family response regulator